MLLRTTNTTLQSAYLPSDIAGGYPEDCICVAEQIANHAFAERTPTLSAFRERALRTYSLPAGCNCSILVVGASSGRFGFPAVHARSSRRLFMNQSFFEQ
jgi:hypothetical protein